MSTFNPNTPLLVSGFTSRRTYPQTGAFSFALIGSVASTSGAFEFGFSGGSGTVGFTFSNGRILDGSSRFLGSYVANQSFSISGSISPSTYDVIINGQPRALGLPRTQTGLLWEVYANAQSTTGAINSLLIIGNPPAYEIGPPLNFSVTGTSPLTGYIQNDSTLPFYVFSGDYNGSSDFELVSFPTGLIAAGGRGNIVLDPTGDYLYGTLSLPMVLYTDFGVLSFSLPLTGVPEVPPMYFINLSGPTTRLPGPTSYQRFFCNYGDYNDILTVVPILQYTSGSGSFSGSILLTGAYSGDLTGYLDGSGYLTTAISVPGTGYTATGNIYTTGQIVETLSGFSYASGNASGWFYLTGTGNVSGSGYYGLATGLLSGYFTGSSPSGSFLVSGCLTGAPSFTVTVNPTGAIMATGAFYLDSLVDNDLFFIGNPNQGILYPSSFVTASDLESYLNTQTGIYGVQAVAVGNVVLLSSVVSGTEGNGVLMQADSCNNGSGYFSGPFTTGGEWLYGSGLPAPNPFSGCYDFMANVSGLFTGFYGGTDGTNGLVTGSVFGLEYQKTLSNVWNLQTGARSITNAFRPTSYSPQMYSGGAVSVSGTSSNFYIQVTYTNNYDSLPDLATLTISGVNQPTGLSIIFTGNAS